MGLPRLAYGAGARCAIAAHGGWAGGCGLQHWCSCMLLPRSAGARLQAGSQSYTWWHTLVALRLSRALCFPMMKRVNLAHPALRRLPRPFAGRHHAQHWRLLDLLAARSRLCIGPGPTAAWEEETIREAPALLSSCQRSPRQGKKKSGQSEASRCHRVAVALGPGTLVVPGLRSWPRGKGSFPRGI